MGDGVDVLAGEAVRLLGDKRRVVLGIAGAPGAGKSTLAVQLVTAVQSVLGDETVVNVPMDGYHLADMQLNRLGLRERKGAPETFDVRGYAALLERCLATPDEPIYAPGFERTIEQPIAAAVVVPPPARLIITEGSYLLLSDPNWDRVRKFLDEVWFVSVDDGLRRSRLIERHMAFGKDAATASRWVLETDEPNAVRVVSTPDRADRVVVNSETGWW